MKKVILLLLFSGLFLNMFVPLSMASSEDKTIIFHSVKAADTTIKSLDASGSAVVEEHLTVYSIYGIKNSIYFAFNFSEFPDNATPQFAVFKVKTLIALDPCYVEAYYSPSIEWINTNLTKENAPDVTSTGSSNFVSDADEWYSFTSTSFVQAAKEACTEKGTLTVCLKARSNTYGDAQATFYNDTKIDVTYLLPSSDVTPSPSIPEFPSLIVNAGLIIVLLSGVAVVYKRRTAKKQ